MSSKNTPNVEPISEGVPTQETVRSWGFDVLHAWLCSMAHPPFKDLGQTAAKFLEAEVDGEVFLDATEKWFADQCNMPAGMAKRLCMIGEAIIKNASGMRKRDRSLDPKESRKGKRARLVGERDQVIGAEINQPVVEKLERQMNELSIDVSKLSRPGALYTLPFPFPNAVPERFHLDENSQFEFFGRHKFAELYKTAKKMNVAQLQRVHFHGTLGAGKSHLLATLVCLLRKEGLRVAYLPDCHKLLMSEPPTHYIITALSIAFLDDIDLAPQISALTRALDNEEYDSTRLEQKVIVFCHRAAQMNKTILFVVDQANALDDSTDDRVSNEKKRDVRKLLEGLYSQHLKISSSTANYRAAKHDECRAISETRITLYRGLDDSEMEAWWGAYESGLGTSIHPDQKTSLERFTGRMPILLQILRGVSKSQNADNSESVPQLSQRIMETLGIKNIVAMINKYATAMFAELKALDDESALESFRRGWQSCIFEQPMEPQDSTYLDGRFSYRDEEGVGRTTCGLAHALGASRVREIENLAEFGDKSLIKRIAHSGDNPAVLGFLVEKVVLGTLIQRGTIFAGPQFSKSLSPQKFSGILPISAPGKDNTAVIYIPTAYNYEAVDAILATRVRKTKKDAAKAIIVGVQVTIARSHSDSEGAFMKSWAGWDELLQGEETEFRFLWIVEDMEDKPIDWVTVPEKTIRLRSKETVVHPEYHRKYISVMSLNNDLGKHLRTARGNQ